MLNYLICERYIHTGLCPYTAKRNHLNELIGNVALLKQTILGNMLSNSKEKSYQCNHCEYATSEATNLSTLKTRNGEQNVK